MDDRLLKSGSDETRSDLVRSLGRGQILASFDGVTPDGRWMLSVSDQPNTLQLAQDSEAAKRRPARSSRRSRVAARRSNPPRLAHAARKVVGFLNPFN
jgi:hypothetical protein